MNCTDAILSNLCRSHRQKILHRIIMDYVSYISHNTKDFTPAKLKEQDL